MELDKGEYFPPCYLLRMSMIIMLIKLSKHGCSMFGHPLGALMCADDLVRLAPTIHELQRALKLCTMEMEKIGFKLNYSKSVGLRIEKNADTSCTQNMCN